MASVNPKNLNDTPVPVPTMSTLGLIYDSANKFDKLLADLFAADSNQTYLYPGEVTTIATLIEKGGSTKDSLEASMREGFTNYFNRYYEDVNVSIAVTSVDDSSARLDFELTIRVSENQNQTQYGRLIHTVRKQLLEIIKLNNDG